MTLTALRKRGNSLSLALVLASLGALFSQNRVLSSNSGEVSLEYVLLAAGLLFLIYQAFSALGVSVADFVMGLPGRLGFG